MSKPKALYRVYDKKTDKYLSFGYKNKSTWTSPVWVDRAIKNNLKTADIDSIEVHVFPVVNGVKYSVKNFKEVYGL
jgi:hypothetical protein